MKNKKVQQEWIEVKLEAKGRIEFWVKQKKRIKEKWYPIGGVSSQN